MKQEIENIIKKNLPEKDWTKNWDFHQKGCSFRKRGKWVIFPCDMNCENVLDNFTQIDTSLIADEVLKVMEKVIDDSIIEYQKEIVKSAEPFIPSDRNRYLIEKLNTLGKKIHRKLSTNSSTLEGEQSEHLSPNKENK